MKRVFSVCFLVVLCVDFSFTARKIPDYVPICKRDTPKLGDCYRDSFNVVLKYLGDGIPAMNLRKIDPLHIDKLTLEQGNSSALGFDAVLSDMDMYGLKDSAVVHADIDIEKLIFNVELASPKLFMTSKFNAKGKVLLFQFDSTGMWTGNLTNVGVKGTWHGKEIQKKGKTHLIFDLPTLDVTIGDMKMFFDNLLPTKELNDRTNQAINENIDVLYEEIKPVIIETVKAVIIDSVNNVYALFPYDVLFPK